MVRAIRAFDAREFKNHRELPDDLRGYSSDLLVEIRFPSDQARTSSERQPGRLGADPESG